MTAVIDASAAVELLLALPLTRGIVVALDRAGWDMHAPHLLTIEVLQVLRRRVSAGITTESDATDALDLLGELGITYHEHEMFAPRIWELRHNVTAYDAAYLALAEAMGVEFITTDARLANAPGHGARVTLVSRPGVL